MNTYIYQADLWCEDCIKDTKMLLEVPEGYYDSDEYPKGPYTEGGGEADCPQHCAAGAECVNAEELADGSKVGCWLENPLTGDGVEYVRDVVKRSPGQVTRLWAEWYAEDLG